MNIEATMVDYYGQRAKEYERIYEKPERQQQLQELKEIVRRTLAGRHVLEVACGTGYWTQVAAEFAASIVALDVNKAVLEIARAKSIDPAKVTFVIADAHKLPAFPRRFDAALVAFLWSHIPKARLGEFLHGLRVALVPEAVVLLMDNTRVAGESTPITRRDAEGNTYQTRRLENGNVFEVLKNYPSEAELRAAVASVGEEIEVVWLKHYWLLRCIARSAAMTRLGRRGSADCQ